MDDGALSFDFEGYLHQQQQTQQQRQQFSNPSSSYQAPSDSRDYRKQANYRQVRAETSRRAWLSLHMALVRSELRFSILRQTVCRHWLRGLCMKGDTCGYLHQYDESRLPVCRWFAKFGSCKVRRPSKLSILFPALFFPLLRQTARLLPLLSRDPLRALSLRAHFCASLLFTASSWCQHNQHFLLRSPTAHSNTRTRM